MNESLAAQNAQFLMRRGDVADGLSRGNPTPGPLPLGLGASYTPQGLIAVLRRHGKLILSCVFGITLLAVVVAFSLPRSYVATSMIILDTRQPEIVQQPAVMSNLVTGGLADPAVVRSEVELIQSPAYARKIIERLHLLDNPEFLRQVKPGPLEAALSSVANGVREKLSAWFGLPHTTQLGSEMGRAIAAFEQHLSVINDEHSYAINLRYDSRNPEFATTVVNSLADLYISDQLATKREVAERAAAWLRDQIKALRDKLNVSERKVAEFALQHQLETVLEGNVPEQRLHDLNRQYMAVVGELAQKQATLAEVKAMLNGPGGADAASQVLSSPLIQKLREQEADAAGRAATLREAFNPSFPVGQARVREIRKLIADEVKRITSALEGEVTAVQAQQAALAASLNQEEKALVSTGLANVQLQQLKRDAATDRQLYDSYMVRYEQVQADEQSLQAGARISLAEVPPFPAFPNRSLLIGLGLFGSLFIGIALAFVREQFDQSIKAAEDAEQATGIASIGLLPKLRNGRTALAAVLEARMSPYSEGVANALVALRAGVNGEKRKVICITSSVQGEGKSVIAASLARVAAKAGLRTLLVDCDLRRPSVATLLGTPKQPTITHMFKQDIRGEIAKSAGVDPQCGLFYLAGELSGEPPQALLSSRWMEEFIAQARHEFDLVVVDTPPLLTAADAVAASRLADTTLLVVRWDHTSRQVVADAAHTLQVQSPTPAAVLLSMVDRRRYARHRGGHYLLTVPAYHGWATRHGF